LIKLMGNSAFSQLANVLRLKMYMLGGQMMDTITRIADPFAVMTRPKIPKIKARQVVTTAASWGLFPKGVAMKKDQLTRERPKTIWTRRVVTMLALTKILIFQTTEKATHAGRWVKLVKRCQELKEGLVNVCATVVKALT